MTRKKQKKIHCFLCLPKTTHKDIEYFLIIVHMNIYSLLEELSKKIKLSSEELRIFSETFKYLDECIKFYENNRIQRRANCGKISRR